MRDVRDDDGVAERRFTLHELLCVLEGFAARVLTSSAVDEWEWR